MEEEIFKVYKDTRIHPTYGTKMYNGHLYEVSNFGRVKVDGIIYVFDDSKFIKKYYKISTFHVHRAVAELFIPNPNNYNEIDHVDRDIHNNHVSNLRWCTHKENMRNPLSRDNMSNIKKCQVTDEFREFMRNINLGRKQSDERRRKTSEIQKGHKPYNEGYFWIHLGEEERMVQNEYIDYWLDDGWIMGRIKGRPAWNKGKPSTLERDEHGRFKKK